MTLTEPKKLAVISAAIALFAACSGDDASPETKPPQGAKRAGSGGNGASVAAAGRVEDGGGNGGSGGSGSGGSGGASAGSGGRMSSAAGRGGSAAAGTNSAAGSGGQQPPTEASMASDEHAAFDPAVFESGPKAWAPGIRWWWPGGAVDDATIETQVGQFADAGYGLVECQPMLTGITQAQVDKNPKIRTVGEPEFFDRLRTLARVTKARELQYDLTLGTGWPSGGRDVPADALEQQILWSRVDVSGPGAVDVTLPLPVEPSWTTQFNEIVGQPIVGAFDTQFSLHAVLAAPLVDGSANPPVLGTPVDVTDKVQDGHLRWEAPMGKHAVLALYRNHTSHVTLGSAYPGKVEDARVVDHMGSGGVRWVIEHQIGPWLDALGDARPVNFFVESLELLGQLPWGGALGESYQKYLGRSPHVDLPFVSRANGETKLDMLSGESQPAFAHEDEARGERMREDYELVRSQVLRAEYVEPLAKAIRERGVALRMQTFGGWGNMLDDYAQVDIPETETLYAGGSFDFIVLAGSAAHIAGRRIVTSEAFTTLNLVSASALDEHAMWLLAGRLYTAGINRLIHSGCPYPFEREAGGDWYPPDPNPDRLGAYTQLIQPGKPEFAFLNAFNKAQARIGYALSRGSPKVDVAWLMTAREVTDVAQPAVGTIGTFAAESDLSAALRAASFTYDRVSASALLGAKAEGPALRVGKASYRALLVDDATVLDPEALAVIDSVAASGVPVVWVGQPPARAYGSVDAEARDARVRELWGALSGRVKRVSTGEVAATLRGAGVSPDVEISGALLGVIGVLHRATASGRLVWLFNEGGTSQTVTATQRVGAKSARSFDPVTGRATDLQLQANANGGTFAITLPAQRGAVVLLAQ